MSEYPEELGQLLAIDQRMFGPMYCFTTGPYWLEDNWFIPVGVKDGKKIRATSKICEPIHPVGGLVKTSQT